MGKLALFGGRPVREAPFPRWPQYDEREARAVQNVFKAGRAAFASAKDWQYKAACRLRFEERFAEFHDCAHGISTTSGTAALMVALRAVGVKPGDEVLTQAYMCIADTEAIVQVGAVPAFCDVNLKNFGLDPADMERRITPKTRAIVAIHFGGYMLDMERLHRIARRKGIAVVEDASLAHGAEWEHRKVGSLSEITCFSLGTDKLITVGEGGMILTNNRDLADICGSLRNSGNLLCGTSSKDRAFGEFTDIRRIGWNYRLTEIPSAIGLVSLQKLAGQIKRRNENGLYLDERLAQIEGLAPLTQDPRQNLQPHGLYLFRIDPKKLGTDKATFIKAVAAEGIPALYGYHNPVYGYSVFKKQAGWKDPRCPESERGCREGIWFSQSVLLGSRKDMNDIVTAFAKVRDHVDELRSLRQ